MRPLALILLAAFLRDSPGQELRLADDVRTVPSLFELPEKPNTPSPATKASMKKLAQGWLSQRVENAKIRDWEFVGVFTGRPLDSLHRQPYSVFRSRFSPPISIGGASYLDLIFFFNRDNELACPSFETPYTNPPPGQMNAVVRERIGG